MPLTIGSVVVIALLIWLLGRGNIKKGAKRFFILEWSLLGIYLMVLEYIVFKELFLKP